MPAIDKLSGARKLDGERATLPPILPGRLPSESLGGTGRSPCAQSATITLDRTLDETLDEALDEASSATGTTEAWETHRVSPFAKIAADLDALADFCRRNGIRRLALFGSALRGDLRPDSDVDLLVEFEPGRVPGLLRVAQMELELSSVFGNREVELRTYADLSPHFRDEVRASALPLYAAA